MIWIWFVLAVAGGGIIGWYWGQRQLPDLRHRVVELGKKLNRLADEAEAEALEQKGRWEMVQATSAQTSRAAEADRRHADVETTKRVAAEESLRSARSKLEAVETKLIANERDFDQVRSEVVAVAIERFQQLNDIAEITRRNVGVNAKFVRPKVIEVLGDQYGTIEPATRRAEQ